MTQDGRADILGAARDHVHIVSALVDTLRSRVKLEIRESRPDAYGGRRESFTRWAPSNRTIRPSVGDATSSFLSLVRFGDVMVEPVIHPHAPRLVARLRIVRAAPLAVHAWTGRSAVSAATNTARPPIATAGTGRTRVSVARLSRSRTWRLAPRALARPVISPRKPRSLEHPRYVSG